MNNKQRLYYKNTDISNWKEKDWKKYLKKIKPANKISEKCCCDKKEGKIHECYKKHIPQTLCITAKLSLEKYLKEEYIKLHNKNFLNFIYHYKLKSKDMLNLPYFYNQRENCARCGCNSPKSYGLNLPSWAWSFICKYNYSEGDILCTRCIKYIFNKKVDLINRKIKDKNKKLEHFENDNRIIKWFINFVKQKKK